eukprot:PRCOL_00005546-RA
MPVSDTSNPSRRALATYGSASVTAGVTARGEPRVVGEVERGQADIRAGDACHVVIAEIEASVRPAEAACSRAP